MQSMYNRMNPLVLHLARQPPPEPTIVMLQGSQPPQPPGGGGAVAVPVALPPPPPPAPLALPPPPPPPPPPIAPRGRSLPPAPPAPLVPPRRPRPSAAPGAYMISDAEPAPSKRGTPSTAPPVPSATPEKEAKPSQAQPTKSVSRAGTPVRSTGARPSVPVAPAASRTASKGFLHRRSGGVGRGCGWRAAGSLATARRDRGCQGRTIQEQEREAGSSETAGEATATTLADRIKSDACV